MSAKSDLRDVFFLLTTRGAASAATTAASNPARLGCAAPYGAVGASSLPAPAPRGSHKHVLSWSCLSDMAAEQQPSTPPLPACVPHKIQRARSTQHIQASLEAASSIIRGRNAPGGASGGEDIAPPELQAASCTIAPQPPRPPSLPEHKAAMSQQRPFVTSTKAEPGTVAAAEAAAVGAAASSSAGGGGSTVDKQCLPPAGAAWQELPGNVLAAVAELLARQPGGTSDVLALCASCAAWRQVVLSYNTALRALRFRLDVSRPFRQPAGTPSLAPWHGSAAAQLLRRYVADGGPSQVLLAAAKAHNVSAAKALARLLEACGEEKESLRWWRRVARAGDIEGAYRLGMALYGGAAGCERSPEDAQVWLSRAVRQLLALDNLSDLRIEHLSASLRDGAASLDDYSAAVSLSTGAVTDGVAGSAAPSVSQCAATGPALPLSGDEADEASAGAASSPAPPPSPQYSPSPLYTLPAPYHGQISGSDQASAAPFQPQTTSRRPSPNHNTPHQPQHLTAAAALARASLVLGYLYFDGEGSARGSDKEQAVRLFRVAAANGSQEAQDVLGWVYNTGQYG